MWLFTSSIASAKPASNFVLTECLATKHTDRFLLDCKFVCSVFHKFDIHQFSSSQILTPLIYDYFNPITIDRRNGNTR
jgi:hypothetical protein